MAINESIVSSNMACLVLNIEKDTYQAGNSYAGEDKPLLRSFCGCCPSFLLHP